jgi:hypothetical protein
MNDDARHETGLSLKRIVENPAGRHPPDAQANGVSQPKITS